VEKQDQNGRSDNACADTRDSNRDGNQKSKDDLHIGLRFNR
jgi:hypothetical protein